MRAVAVSLPLLLIATTAYGRENAPRDFEVALALGYALPVGTSEEGARLSDQTYGAIPVDLTLAYRLSRLVAVAAAGRYGPVIPTLCTDSSDCVSSVGHDVSIAARVRFFLPKFLDAEPYGDAGAGYEWFASKLVDAGATSTHSYHGPMLFSGEVGMPFELGKGWTLGPALGLGFGMFIGSRLDSPGVSRDLGVSDPSIHGWLSLAVRASVRF